MCRRSQEYEKRNSRSPWHKTTGADAVYKIEYFMMDCGLVSIGSSTETKMMRMVLLWANYWKRADTSEATRKASVKPLQNQERLKRGEMTRRTTQAILKTQRRFICRVCAGSKYPELIHATLNVRRAGHVACRNRFNIEKAPVPWLMEAGAAVERIFTLLGKRRCPGARSWNHPPDRLSLERFALCHRPVRQAQGGNLCSVLFPER